MSWENSHMGKITQNPDIDPNEEIDEAGPVAEDEESLEDLLDETSEEDDF